GSNYKLAYRRLGTGVSNSSEFGFANPHQLMVSGKKLIVSDTNNLRLKIWNDLDLLINKEELTPWNDPAKNITADLIVGQATTNDKSEVGELNGIDKIYNTRAGFFKDGDFYGLGYYNRL